jgi:general secretion pathway protein E
VRGGSQPSRISASTPFSSSSGLCQSAAWPTRMPICLGIPITSTDRYPSVEPVLPSRLTAAFLRHARAVPLDADAETLTLATADPLDAFTHTAVSVATARRVRLEVAVPIELEAALNRLYPEAADQEQLGAVSQRPVNRIITR